MCEHLKKKLKPHRNQYITKRKFVLKENKNKLIFNNLNLMRYVYL